jgi:hypothetical protein
MVGLPGHMDDLTDYKKCISLIENQVKKFTADELERMNAKNKQAGVTCLKPHEFNQSEHVIPRIDVSLQMLIIFSRGVYYQNNRRGA